MQNLNQFSLNNGENYKQPFNIIGEKRNPEINSKKNQQEYEQRDALLFQQGDNHMRELNDFLNINDFPNNVEKQNYQQGDPNLTKDKKDRKIINYDKQPEESKNQNFDGQMNGIRQVVDSNYERLFSQSMFNTSPSLEDYLQKCKEIFPFKKPYIPQIESFKQIISSLQSGKNLLFQSPTGSGKTLMSICSALAFADQKEDVQILFLTRTNEQINGLIKEIRKIKSYPDIHKYAILAGRNQFCLKQKQFQTFVAEQGLGNKNQNKLLNLFCESQKESTNSFQFNEEEDNNSDGGKRNLMQKMQGKQNSVDQYSDKFQVPSNRQINKEEYNQNGCVHYSRYKRIAKQVQNDDNEFEFRSVLQYTTDDYSLPDIEDMKWLFEEKQIGCPYYLNRLAVESAKIVFATYNYIIKQDILDSIKHLLKKNIILIFDEAHNITDIAEQELKVNMKFKHCTEFYTTFVDSSELFKSKHPLNKTLREMIKYDIEKESTHLQKQIINLTKQKQDSSYQNNNYQDDNYDDNEEDEDELISIMRRNYFNEEQQRHAKQDIKKEQQKSSFKFKDNSQYDLYDQIQQILSSKSINIVNKSNQKISPLIDFIQNVKQQQRCLSDQLNIFIANYKRLREQEIFLLMDNLQDKEVQTILDIYQNLNEYFTIKEPFCTLFSNHDQISDHLINLNLLETKYIQKFLYIIQNAYHLFVYVRKVISLSKYQLQSEQQFGNYSNGTLMSKLKEFSYQHYLPQVYTFAESVKLKYFSNVWTFYKKILDIRSDYNMKQEQNHYLSLQRETKFKSKYQFLEIGSLSSELLFEQIRKKISINSMILQSGTLQPFELISKNINIPFEEYSASSIIDSKNNLFTCFINSFSNREISFRYSSVQANPVNEDVIQVIQLILNPLLQCSSHSKKKAGTVIFFKNYSLLNSYYYTINSVFQNDFKVYREPNDTKEFNYVYQDYKKTIGYNQKNCIFLAVNRGKLSEGIDLKDDLCRIVILLGVPYAMLNDPYIICKRDHAKQFLNENSWYEKVTAKVVNQSAGRCIRDINDWGGIFFVDQSFQSRVQNLIQQWIKDGEKDFRLWQQFLQQKIE